MNVICFTAMHTCRLHISFLPLILTSTKPGEAGDICTKRGGDTAGSDPFQSYSAFQGVEKRSVTPARRRHSDELACRVNVLSPWSRNKTMWLHKEVDHWGKQTWNLILLGRDGVCLCVCVCIELKSSKRCKNPIGNEFLAASVQCTPPCSIERLWNYVCV